MICRTQNDPQGPASREAGLSRKVRGAAWGTLKPWVVSGQEEAFPVPLGSWHLIGGAAWLPGHTLGAWEQPSAQTYLQSTPSFGRPWVLGSSLLLALDEPPGPSWQKACLSPPLCMSVEELRRAWIWDVCCSLRLLLCSSVQLGPDPCSIL